MKFLCYTNITLGVLCILAGLITLFKGLSILFLLGAIISSVLYFSIAAIINSQLEEHDRLDKIYDAVRSGNNRTEDKLKAIESKIF